MDPYRTIALYDPSEKHWYVGPTDVPGLLGSGNTVSELIKEVDERTPILMQSNVVRNPALPVGYRHDGVFTEIEHHVLALKPDGTWEQHSAAKIDWNALLIGPDLIDKSIRPVSIGNSGKQSPTSPVAG